MTDIVPYQKRLNAMKEAEREIESKLTGYSKSTLEYIRDEYVQNVMKKEIEYCPECMNSQQFMDYVLRKYGANVGHAWVLYEIKGWYSKLAFFKPEKEKDKL